METFRFWLSAQLLSLGIRAIPDFPTKNAFRIGLYVASQLATGRMIALATDDGIEIARPDADLEPATIH